MPLFQFNRAENENKESIPAKIMDSNEPAPRMDFRIVGIAILTVLFLWVCSIIYTGYACWAAYMLTCSAQAWAFWSLPAFIFIAVVFILMGWTITAIISWRNRAEKERLANAFTQHYDAYDVRNLQKMLIAQVAQEVAKSLASAEIDTYSPTIHTSSNVSTTAVNSDTKNETEELPLGKDKSTLEELLDKGLINRSNNSLFVGFAKDEE